MSSEKPNSIRPCAVYCTKIKILKELRFNFFFKLMAVKDKVLKGTSGPKKEEIPVTRRWQKFQMITNQGWNGQGLAGFEVLTAVIAKSSVLCDATLGSPLEVNRLFGGTCRLQLQGRGKSQERNLLHADFLLGLFFDPEDGDMLVRNVGWFSMDYKALCILEDRTLHLGLILPLLVETRNACTILVGKPEWYRPL
jgi:hypothetical protein